MKLEEAEDKPNMDDFADDAFLMVSQLHWEVDVVWNGDDIKHKVSESASHTSVILLKHAKYLSHLNDYFS